MKIQRLLLVGRVGEGAHGEGDRRERLRRPLAHQDGRHVAGVENAHPTLSRGHDHEHEGGEPAGQTVPLEDDVGPVPQAGQVRRLGRDGPERGLELGHEEGGPQPLSRNVPQHDAHGPLVEGHVIHQVTAHVVGGPCIQPRLPSLDGRVLLGEKSQLDGAPHLEFVPGQELVSKFQHEDHEEDHNAGGGQAHADVHVPRGEPEVAHHEGPQAEKDQEPAHRSELEEEAPQEVPHEGQPPAEGAHGLEPPLPLFVQVKLVEVSQIPLQGLGETPPLHVGGDGPAEIPQVLGQTGGDLPRVAHPNAPWVLTHPAPSMLRGPSGAQWVRYRYRLTDAPRPVVL